MKQVTFAILALLTLLPGCAQPGQGPQVQRAVSDYFAGDGASAARRLRPLAQKTDENFVLNNLRLGSAAMISYDLAEAEGAFLRAYEVMNSYGVNDGGHTLGAIVISESVKVWKGEPFERAMCSFYLGQIYYIEGDYQNARAAFESALFKLRDYGESKDRDDEYRKQEADFAVAYLMLGKCWQKLGDPDKAKENFDRARELRSSLAPACDEKLQQDSNLLLMIDYGYGPQKVTTAAGVLVGFSPTAREEGPIPSPVVRVDGRPAALNGVAQPPVDLLVLAQERRWQSIDTARAVKAAIGAGLVAVGGYEAMKKDKPRPAEGLILAGTGLLLIASSQADTRQWEMLPRSTFIIPLHLPPGKHDVTVSFPGVGSRAYTQTWHGLVAPTKGEAAYYLRIPRWDGPFTWPPRPDRDARAVTNAN